MKSETCLLFSLYETPAYLPIRHTILKPKKTKRTGEGMTADERGQFNYRRVKQFRPVTNTEIQGTLKPEC